MPTTHDYYDDPRNVDIKIYIDGDFFHRNEAKVSVLDSGFLLGDGVWEGIRLHNSKLLHLEKHLNRLFAGAKALDLDIHLSKDEIKNALMKTIELNNMNSDVHIRLIVSRGLKKTPYQHPKATIGKPTIVIIPEYKVADKSVTNDGIKLALVDTIRDFRVQNPNVNSLSKHNCIAACIEAERKGADEGLMLDPNGFISTCNSTNFFIIRSNEVWTSSGQYCLHGITRSTVIDLCKNKYGEDLYEIFENAYTKNNDLSSATSSIIGSFGVISASF